ncbi:MAG: hypothetical protein KF897_03910 [Opitutaceae bacterium]|nr:hypothetical protein [Opitutaceae bacterium]
MEQSSPPPSLDWAHRLHAGRGWLADLLRLPLSALHWNTVKTWYVVRGRRGHCPCHDPSDSGAPGRTRCLAVLHWHSPARFRRVCPLLVSTEHGWCCRAAPAQVRPFWGRVLAVTALLGLAVYIAGSLAALGLLHRAGYDQLRYTDVIWPGNWGRFKVVQAHYYRALGDEALRRRDYRQAQMAYATAMATAPDYPSGLALAILSSYAGNYAYSDSLFIRLRHEFPAEHERTAVAFHDQLLGSLRLRRLADLCLAGLVHPDRSKLPWVRLLVFVATEGRFASDLERDRAEVIARLPAGARGLLRAHALAETGKQPAALAALAAIRPADGSWFYVAAIQAMVRMNAIEPAQLSLYAHGHEIAEFDRAYLQYLITWQRGDRELAHGDFRALLPFARDPLLVDRICGLLIATRDQAALGQLWAEVQKHPREPQALVALLTAARVGGDFARVRAIATRLGWNESDREKMAAPLDFLANRPDDPKGLRFLLATTDLPRETILALVAASVRERLAVADAEARRRR